MFATTSPVTAVAELAVKNAFTKPTEFPSTDAMGRLRNVAPIKITIKNDIPKNKGAFLTIFSYIFVIIFF